MPALNPYWLLIVAGVVACLPILVGLATAYLKVSIVLGMLRSGLGAQNVPSGLVVMVLSLALTLFIMAPMLSDSYDIIKTLPTEQIFREPSLGDLQRYQPALEPWERFLRHHAGHRELAAFVQLDRSSKEPSAEADAQPTASSVDFKLLLPAFILTELKEAFAMAFVLLLPFLVIDLVVANILVGLGMFMVSPVMIALPLKLILFVAADGWLLLTRGLILSYRL